jgi:hypothetical protein
VISPNVGPTTISRQQLHRIVLMIGTVDQRADI